MDIKLRAFFRLVAKLRDPGVKAVIDILDAIIDLGKAYRIEKL